MSVLLYNSETWNLERADETDWEYSKCPCWEVCGISLRDRWRNEEFKSRLGNKLDVAEKMRRCWLTYFGHIIKNHHAWKDSREQTNRTTAEKLTNVVAEDCDSRVVSFTQARRLAMGRKVEETGVWFAEAFYRVANAISQVSQEVSLKSFRR